MATVTPSSSNDELIERFETHENSLGRGREPVKQRRRLLGRLAGVCAPRLIVDATKQDILAVLAGLSAHPSTRNWYVSRYAGFFQWAIVEELCDGDPTMKIQRAREPRSLPRPISDRQLAVALEGADPRMRLILTLAAFAGLRCKEIAGLRAEHLGDGLGRIRVFEGKGGHQRVVPMHPKVRQALMACGWPQHGPVVRRAGYGSRRGRHDADTNLSAHRISDVVADYLHGLGIDATAHMLRHWFGTRFYANTKDLLRTRDVMGHASARTTEGYAKVTFDERVVAAVEAIDLDETPESDPHNAEVPMCLSEFLETDLELTDRAAEIYGTLILGAHHCMTDETRNEWGLFHAGIAWKLANGKPAELEGFDRIEPYDTGAIRHHMWLAEGLYDSEVADRLEESLPHAVLRSVWRGIAARRAEHPDGWDLAAARAR